MEVMERTKKMRDGSWICGKAKEVAEAYEARRQALDDGSASDPGPQAQNALFLELVGGKGKKGNVWSMGDLGDLYLSQSSPSSAQSSSAESAAVQSLRQEVQALTTQVGEIAADRDQAIADRNDLIEALRRATLAWETTHQLVQELRGQRQPPPPPPPPPSADPPADPPADLDSDS